jgi:hypothetical protein
VFKNNLNELFIINETSVRNSKSFKKILLDEIYFGKDYENIDEETGMKFIYYAYFRSKYFVPYEHNHEERKIVDDDKSFQLRVGMCRDLKNCF